MSLRAQLAVLLPVAFLRLACRARGPSPSRPGRAAVSSSRTSRWRRRDRPACPSAACAAGSPAQSTYFAANRSHGGGVVAQQFALEQGPGWRGHGRGDVNRRPGANRLGDRGGRSQHRQCQHKDKGKKGSGSHFRSTTIPERGNGRGEHAFEHDVAGDQARRFGALGGSRLDTPRAIPLPSIRYRSGWRCISTGARVRSNGLTFHYPFQRTVSGTKHWRSSQAW